MDTTQLQTLESVINKNLDAFTAKMNEEIKHAGSAAEETKSAIQATDAKLFEVQIEIAKLAQKQIELETASKRIVANGERSKSFSEHIMEAATLADVTKMFEQSKAGQFQVKATMTTAANLLNDTIRPERLPGVIYPMPSMTRVRQVLPVLPLNNTNGVEWMVETGYTSNADTVSDGSNKPEDDLTIDTESIPARTIATTMRLHKNMLADLPLLSSYLATRGVDSVMDVEDDQLLYGNGNTPNLTGILTNSLSAFNPFNLYAAMVAQGNRGAGYYDILRFAILQARLSNLRPNAILLSPADKAVIDTLQIQDGAYRRQPDGTVLVNNIWGLPVAEVDAMNAGEFAIVTAGAASIFEREGMTIGFFEQDRDNVQKNLVTVRIEERILVATQRPEGIVTGEFSDYLNKYAS